MPELMNRTQYWSLSDPDREAWAKRLKDQWNVELTDAREFWFDGDRITGVTIMKRNSEGKRYAIGHDVATELLGSSV